MPPRRPRFDARDQRIPPILRERIESWQSCPPSSQFQQYEPIDRYLNLKFYHDDHMVKPQALLRETVSPLDNELLRNWGTSRDDPLPPVPEDANTVEDLRILIEKGDISIDSTHNGFVDKRVKIDSKAYPDFAVCSFVGDPRRGEEKDRVLVVVEIGSLPRGKGREDCSEQELRDTRNDVLDQLEKYMDTYLGEEGDRWDDHVIGIALLGTEVAFIKPNSDSDNSDYRAWKTHTGSRGKTWFSLYSKEFLNHVNEARDRD